METAAVTALLYNNNNTHINYEWKLPFQVTPCKYFISNLLKYISQMYVQFRLSILKSWIWLSCLNVAEEGMSHYMAEAILNGWVIFTVGLHDFA